MCGEEFKLLLENTAFYLVIRSMLTVTHKFKIEKVAIIQMGCISIKNHFFPKTNQNNSCEKSTKK